MRNIIILILFISAITSSCDCFFCEDVKRIPSEFMPFYDVFIQEGIKRGQDYSDHPIIIKFGKTDAMGHSKWRIDNVADIVINEEIWNEKRESRIYYNAYKNELTIFHEMAHAILKRDHIDTCMSIMKVGDYCKYYNYHNNRDKMFDELFGVTTE